MKKIMRTNPSTLCRLVTLAFVATLIQSCESGSLGSDVGESIDVDPTARLQVLNAGDSNTFREGAEILLTGKASEDADGPILEWEFEQTAGPAAAVVERTSNTISVTAPDVSDETVISFRLSVTDSSQLVTSDSVDIIVVPAQDADRFLTLGLQGGEGPRDSFTIIPILAASNGADQPFILSIKAYLIYPAIGSDADCRTETLPAGEAAVLDSNSECSIALMQENALLSSVSCAAWSC